MTAMERIAALEKRVAELERQLTDNQMLACPPRRPFDWERQPTSGDPLPQNPIIIT